MTDLRLAVQTLLVPGESMEEKFANARDYGYDAIEIAVGPSYDLGENPEDISEIPAVAGTEESVKQKVIEAHRVLMGISEENRERFKDLLTALERG